ncbi:metallophosphoesterase [Methanobrevibacter sp.]|uniref:metallophosphoesterase n=1 Tax=Methanobrevibacter sp. TaxID=66852 RepID=UPI0038653DF2
MKLIVTSDWHLRATRPRCRTDENWIETQRNALAQIKKISVKKNAPVFVVGDLFHSNSDTSFECIQLVQSLADELSELYILAGNHDLPYHSSENINKSAIGILLNSNNIASIREFNLWVLNHKDVTCSCSNFDEVDNKDAEIVFKHTLVFPDLKSLPPNVDAITAKELLEEFSNAKWIFTGDYHRNFHYEKNGRHVVNPGCLLRQASDMKNYKCGVYYVDTDENIVEFVPIIDNESFVDDSYILKQEEREERIESFVDKLSDTKNVSLDFVDNVQKAMLENNFGFEIKTVVEELMEV